MLASLDQQDVRPCDGIQNRACSHAVRGVTPTHYDAAPEAEDHSNGSTDLRIPSITAPIRRDIYMDPRFDATTEFYAMNLTHADLQRHTIYIPCPIDSHTNEQYRGLSTSHGNVV